MVDVLNKWLRDKNNLKLIAWGLILFGIASILQAGYWASFLISLLVTEFYIDYSNPYMLEIIFDNIINIIGFVISFILGIIMIMLGLNLKKRL